MMEFTPCKVENGVVKLCKTLLSAVEIDKRKGLSVSEFVNVNTGETTRTAVVVRSGDHSKRGIILNFCPFCGESIGHQFKGEEVAAS